MEKKTVPIYKLKNGVLVKVGEIPYDEALNRIRMEEPDAEDVEAIYITDEEPEGNGEDREEWEFNLEKELEEISKKGR